MTLLDNTGLPVWVYILVIVIGSILLLATIALSVRCWFQRRRARRRPTDFDGLTGPTRRVTLRRGRMVPTSQHLSLTGSKFGMRQFGALADTESTITGRRSPFEWWNTIMDRSQSRQDQMSQLETGSILTRPTSRATTLTGRREFLSSTPTQTPEKTKEPVTRTWEVTLPSPSPSPSPSPESQQKTINFSRSFSNRAPSSPLTQRSQLTLSRISERSPHQSMISPANGPVISTPNRSSHLSAINPLDNTPLPNQLLPLSPITPAKSMTLGVPSPEPSSVRRSVSLSQEQSTPSNPILPPDQSQPSSRLSVPKPVVYRSSASALRSNPVDVASPTPNTFYRQPNPSRFDLSPSAREDGTPSPATSSTHLSRKSSASIGPSANRQDSRALQIPYRGDYSSSRLDLEDANRRSTGNPRSGHTSRNPSTDQTLQRHTSSFEQGREKEKENLMGIVTVSGKNNTKVLRKKSLKRMQVVSSVMS